MIKIALTGPECSGKTSLATELGNKLGVSWIPEFARHYLSDLNQPYTQSDLDVIAKQQQKFIDMYLKTNSKYMIVDTEMLVLKIWSEEKYQEVSPLITSLYEQQNFDLVVLCKPDMPFEADDLRENPDDRDRLYQLYMNELKASNTNFVIAESDLNSRINRVLTEIEKL